MSLINNLLKDLDKRNSKTDAEQKQSLDEYIKVQGEQESESRSRLPFILVIGALAIGGVYVWKYGIPWQSTFKAPMVANQPLPTKITKAPEPVPVVASAPVKPLEDSAPKIAQVTHSALLKAIDAKNNASGVELSFEFDDAVEYELVDKGELEWFIKFSAAGSERDKSINFMNNPWIESVQVTPENDQLIAKVKLAQSMSVHGLPVNNSQPGLMRFGFDAVNTETKNIAQPDESNKEDLIAMALKVEEADSQALLNKENNAKSSVMAKAYSNLALDSVTKAKQKQTIKTRLSKKEQANKWFDESITLLGQGDVSLALPKLKRALSTDEKHILARETLAKVLIKTGQLSSARQVIDKGLRLHRGHHGFLKLKARVIHAVNGSMPALKFLKRNAPKFSSDLEYQSFMAALYQKTGQSQPAADIYEKLLRINPSQGRWQFGFGMALDSLGHYVEAKMAYQRALDLDSSLNKESIEYIKGRVKELRRL